MAAAHHFYGHNRPLPIAQILNDGSFFSQRHVAFLLRPLLLGSKAASWFALTAIRLDYPYSLEVEDLPIIRYGGSSSFLWTQQAFTPCADSE
jgi:hypothetical protein